MIAFARDRRCADPSVASKRTAPSFQELLPDIKSQAQFAFRGSPVSEREELIAETIANAFCAYQQLAERGKADVAYATPLANFAIKQIRSGRRVGQRMNVNDVTSAYSQRAKGITVEQLGSRVDSTSPRCSHCADEWQEVVVEDRNATPADIAATRIDFAAWLKTLRPKRRRIAKVLATGETTAAAARKFGISSGRISQLRRELQLAWQMFQGELVIDGEGV